jgi:hypothetical protein
VCGLASLGWPGGAAAQSDEVFGHVQQASIVADHGVPRVLINGQPVLPFIKKGFHDARFPVPPPF